MDEPGRVMFGVGALIAEPHTGKILVLKRSSGHSNFNGEKWELVYGRKHQHEDIEAALRRECREELGVDLTEIGPVLRLWHFYRGEPKPETEIIGVTFLCSIGDQEIRLSAEHSEYRWLSPEEALELITVSGIRDDVTIFIEQSWKNGLIISDLSGVVKHYH